MRPLRTFPDVSEESDRRVWERVLAGDSREFGVLFDRHRDRVFRHLLRSVDDRTDAEDLTATVFLELWRHRRSVRFVDDSLLPWLLVTAGNVARNAARARRRYRLFLARLPQPATVQDAAETAADTLALDERLSALPTADRRLVTLTALEGFSLREASEAVGISYPAAKMRMSRIRSRLGADLDLLPENGTAS